jgi:hypothetical protein
LLAAIRSLSDAATWCFFAAFWALAFAIIAVEVSIWAFCAIVFYSVASVISSVFLVLSLLNEILTSPTPRSVLVMLAIAILGFIVNLVIATLMLRRAWRIATAVWRRWEAWRERRAAAVAAAPTSEKESPKGFSPSVSRRLERGTAIRDLEG